jgi:hypothetical protein
MCHFILPVDRQEAADEGGISVYHVMTLLTFRTERYVGYDWNEYCVGDLDKWVVVYGHQC